MNRTKKILAAFIAAATVLAMAGCGASETSDSTASTNNTQAAADKDSAASTSNNQAADDKETTEQTEPVTEEAKAPVGKLEDRPKLTIELKDGKTFIYNGESFSEIYPKLIDLGLVSDDAKEDYEKDGVFNSGYVEAGNGTIFCIDYLPNKKEFIVRTGSGFRDGVIWNIKIGNIDNKTTIADVIDMGATEVTGEISNSGGYSILSYLLTSENFETKGISIDFDEGSPDDLAVAGVYITYSGVEE